jgi:hypothetical protein
MNSGIAGFGKNDKKVLEKPGIFVIVGDMQKRKLFIRYLSEEK